MAAPENKAIVRRYLEEVWGEGKISSLDEVVATDLVDHNPLPGQAQGIEGQIEAVTLIRSALPDLRIDVQDLIADGDKVVDRWILQGTHRGPFLGIPASGKPVTITGMDIVRVVNGKIAEIWHQEDILGLLQQIGAIPAAAPAH